MELDNLHQDLLEFFDSECGLETTQISDETALFSSNLLDSLDLLDLISFIERDYGVKVNPLEVGLESFDTMSRIIEFVQKKSIT